jgi:subtilisin family serine protease
MCFLIDFEPPSDYGGIVASELESLLLAALFMHKYPLLLKINPSILDVMDSESRRLQDSYVVSDVGALSEEMIDLSDKIKMHYNRPRTLKDFSEYTSYLAVEHRNRDHRNMTEVKHSIRTSLKSYSFQSMSSHKFGIDSTRGRVLRQFSDKLSTLSNYYGLPDPCNMESALVTAQHDLTFLSIPEIDPDLPFGPMCLGYAVSTLLQDEDILHVFIMARPDVLNYRARSIIQSSTVGSTIGFSPYSDAGLNGQGQTVGVADTGLDMTSCYFFDPTGFVSFSENTAPKFDQSRRKVVQYLHFSDSDTSDVVGGHGTHVCGTVAGSNPTSANGG